MTWKIRHEGSPRFVEGLTPAQVVEGLQDGMWEPTDEVMGPGDGQWAAIEQHPQFAEVAADIEPPERIEPEDESRLDMNPLIDVALVLLIFFIITATYDTIRKVLDVPGATAQNLKGPLKITEKEVQNSMIRLEVRVKGKTPVIKVEDKTVKLAELENELRDYVNRTQRAQLLIDAVGVDWGTLVAIQDAAKGAGMDRAYWLKQPDGKK